jgi:hypothetical protein
VERTRLVDSNFVVLTSSFSPRAVLVKLLLFLDSTVL